MTPEMFKKRHKTSHPDEKDKKILELLTQDPSLSDEELGKIVGLSREAIVRRKQRPGYQSLLTESISSSKDIVKHLVDKSLSELELLLNDPDPRVRLTAISLSLKFMPDKPVTIVSKELLSDLVQQPNFIEELFKIPGVGHQCFMYLINNSNMR